jgi:glycosyltransferase involved in cell wall biosynthesis
MKAVPRLSVGLPVVNGEDYLVESLEALLGQTYGDFELILSDNASTDGTTDICQHYAKQDLRIRYFRQPRNIGCSPNHNFVIQEARAELFKMASHDDLYARDLLKRCVDALDEFPQFVLAHSWSALIDSSGTITNFVQYPVATDARERRIVFVACCSTAGETMEAASSGPRSFVRSRRLIATTSPTGRSSPRSACTARSTRSRIGFGSDADTPSRQECVICVTGVRCWIRAGRTACGTRLFACTPSTSWAM